MTSELTRGTDAIVRRRPGTLVRPTDDGYLVHNGTEVVALTGLEAEIFSVLTGTVPVGTLTDLAAARTVGETDDELFDDIVAALAGLRSRRAIEVVTE